MTTTTTLYQTKDDQYGTFLVKNSQGKIVLEMKGTGEVKAFDVADLTEVRPYTVQISFESGGNHGHFEVPEGSLAKGDIVMDGLNVGRVSAINTLNKSPRSGDNLVKLVTQPLAA